VNVLLTGEHIMADSDKDAAEKNLDEMALFLALLKSMDN